MSAIIWKGDSTQLTQYIEGPIHAIVTDPPYGMAYKSNSAKLASGKRWNRAIANDDNPEQAIITFKEAVAPMIPNLADEADVYVFCKWDMDEMWREAVHELGLQVYMQLIWDKMTPGQGDLVANWPVSYEVIIYAKKGRRPIASRRPSIISVPRTPHSAMVHPTEKPVALIEILLNQSTNPGDLIVDPFSGSGSTAMAAKRLNRRCIGIELDDEHHRRSVARLEQGVFDL